MPTYNRFETAIFIKNAVNPIAVVRELLTALDDAIFDMKSVRAALTDPAVIVLIHKLDTMVGGSERSFAAALSACQLLALVPSPDPAQSHSLASSANRSLWGSPIPPLQQLTGKASDLDPSFPRATAATAAAVAKGIEIVDPLAIGREAAQASLNGPETFPEYGRPMGHGCITADTEPLQMEHEITESFKTGNEQ